MGKSTEIEGHVQEAGVFFFHFHMCFIYASRVRLGQLNLGIARNRSDRKGVVNEIKLGTRIFYARWQWIRVTNTDPGGP